MNFLEIFHKRSVETSPSLPEQKPDHQQVLQAAPASRERWELSYVFFSPTKRGRRQRESGVVVFGVCCQVVAGKYYGHNRFFRVLLAKLETS